jgi:hypothetical protein
MDAAHTPESLPDFEPLFPDELEAFDLDDTPAIDSDFSHDDN